jgi:copper chaperone
MYDLQVPDMTCGHCASTITKAVKQLDPAARLEFSLGEHRVSIASAMAREELFQAIQEAGYTPQEIAS